MTEEMRYLSRVKGEERQLFRHTVGLSEKSKHTITVLAPFVPTERTSIDIQGEGPGTGEPLSDAQVVSILVVRALFRAPLVVVSRRCELVVNQMAWLTGQIRLISRFLNGPEKCKKMRKKKFGCGG